MYMPGERTAENGESPPSACAFSSAFFIANIERTDEEMSPLIRVRAVLPAESSSVPSARYEETVKKSWFLPGARSKAAFVF